MKMREDGSEKDFGINVAVFRQLNDGVRVEQMESPPTPTGSCTVLFVFA